MTEFDRGRRRFLTSTALAGAGVLAVGREAQAFSEQKMSAAEHKAYLNACRAGDAYHEQLLQQAETELGQQLSADQRREALAVLRCPICGCPLVAELPKSGSAGPG
jgi:hypothetical protein